MAATDNLQSNYQLTASSTAALLAGARPNFTGGIVIQNLSTTVDAYVGDANVTAATGFKIAAGTTIPIPTLAAIYAITASSTADLRGLAI